jgi:hypothetical protein
MIVDGGFASNLVYGSLLAALRRGSVVLLGGEHSGSLLFARHLCGYPAPARLLVAKPLKCAGLEVIGAVACQIAAVSIGGGAVLQSPPTSQCAIDRRSSALVAPGKCASRVRCIPSFQCTEQSPMRARRLVLSKA